MVYLFDNALRGEILFLMHFLTSILDALYFLVSLFCIFVCFVCPYMLGKGEHLCFDFKEALCLKSSFMKPCC